MSHWVLNPLALSLEEGCYGPLDSLMWLGAASLIQSCFCMGGRREGGLHPSASTPLVQEGESQDRVAAVTLPFFSSTGVAAPVAPATPTKIKASSQSGYTAALLASRLEVSNSVFNFFDLTGFSITGQESS